LTTIQLIIAEEIITTLEKESICGGVYVMSIAREQVVEDILKKARLAI
jgi:hypothetical protein